MKNMKIKIMSAVLISTLISPAAAVYAEGTTKYSDALAKTQQHIEASQQKLQTNSALKSKRDTIKQNHAANQALSKEVSQKKETLKGINKDIRTAHKQLTSDDLGKIDAELTIIKNDAIALESTKGTIDAAYQKAKDAIKAKNYQEAEAQLDNVISIQATRSADLKKLSGDLDVFIGIMQTADNNGTVKSASTTNSVPPTT